MTQGQMIELIQQHHPGMGETLIRLNLNRAQDDFCTQAETNKSTFTDTSVAGQRYYDLNSKVLHITEVQVNDVSIPRLIGKPIIDDDEHTGAGLSAGANSTNDRFWYIDSARLGIVEKIAGVTTRDDKVSDYQSISKAGLEIRTFAISKVIDFTSSLTSSSKIPEQFHDALIYKVISEGYTLGGTQEVRPDMATYFDRKYLEMVKKGRKFARGGYTGKTTIIRATDF